MQVKVFESPDMASGLKMVRRELGADALILSTRTVHNSRLGPLGKSTLEITAAIDELPSSFKKGINNSVSTPESQRSPAGPLFNNQKLQSAPENNSSGALFTLTPTKRSQKTRTASSSKENTYGNQPGRDMNAELTEIKSMIRSLSGEVSLLRPHRARQEPIPEAQPRRSVRKHESETSLIKILDGFGISPETAEILSTFAFDSLTLEEQADDEKLTSFLQEMIGGFLHVSPPDFSDKKQHRIALVGPTGVGKTTTLAKIAALCVGSFRKSVALITIDTYRIAAVEQLKVYGEIMGLPVDVVLTPAQFQEALDNHKDADVILIDTAGRSPRDTLSIDELSTFFDVDPELEKYLVLSAATREVELMETITSFQKLDLDKTIITKIDECCSLGVILNTQLKNPTPLSYLTNGQRVPEDLLEIDREAVAKLVIPSIQGSVHDRKEK